MYNSRTYPTHPVYSVSVILISMVAGKSHKKPHHPSKVPAMNCLRPKPAASGFRFSPLHFKATLCSATFRSIPFIVILKPRLLMQECFQFIPLRSYQPSVSFRSPLAFPPTTRNSKPKREAPFHSPQFATLHSVLTLAFSNTINGKSC